MPGQRTLLRIGFTAKRLRDPGQQRQIPVQWLTKGPRATVRPAHADRMKARLDQQAGRRQA
jgi:hypothetical protein